MKHADGELVSMLEESSPPVDLCRVTIFRVVARKYEKQAGIKPPWNQHVLIKFDGNEVEILIIFSGAVVWPLVRWKRSVNKQLKSY